MSGYSLPSVFLLVSLLIGLQGCASDRYVQYETLSPQINEHFEDRFELPELHQFNNDDMEELCLRESEPHLAQAVVNATCALEMLGREGYDSHTRDVALNQYNRASETLLRHYLADPDREWVNPDVKLRFVGPDLSGHQHFLLSQLKVLDARLEARVFGGFGVPAVSVRPNQLKGQDEFYPLEGIVRPLVYWLQSVEVNEQSATLVFRVQTVNDHTEITVGSHQYGLKYSPAAAFLVLIDQADIDDLSWTGLISPAKAEARRGIFAIQEQDRHKIPIVMIHGLNSDPLIWKYLTMAILNDEALYRRYQIWHAYYPSGPPPFYSAMKVRGRLKQLLASLDNPPLAAHGVVIGHSMGGVIGRTLVTDSRYALWDATFTRRPQQLGTDVDEDLQDIFIFTPPFADNEVFFLDTPHLGSATASSTIGYIGASLVELPQSFLGLFNSFFETVGVDILTEPMKPFLAERGPNSIEVLRPDHPIMTALSELPVQGRAYSVIGAQGILPDCSQVELCADVSDGVVAFSSAYLADAEDTLVVTSSHNSFQSPEAIEFILQKLYSTLPPI